MSLSKSLNPSDLMAGLRAGVRGARLSVVEIVFLVAAIFFAVLVMFFYLTKIQPKESALRNLQQREKAARDTLDRMDKQRKDLESQHANAEKIVESLTEFEGRLKDRQQGYTQIIDEVNQLTKSNHVAGGEFGFRVTAAEVADENGNPIQPAVRSDRNLNIYPSLGIDTTVEGDYHDLRRFISDLERSKQFVIINALVFQGPGADRKTRRGPKGAAPGQAPASADSVPVSLKIEMDTYFQKRAAP